MSKYTVELRWLIEKGYPLGLTEYPIYDELHRPIINAKILSRYKFREIGFETPAMFVDRLNERMGTIMPYFNQLYRSELLDFEPLITNLYTETNATDSEANDQKTSTQKAENDSTASSSDITNTGSSTKITGKASDILKETNEGSKTNVENGENTNSNSDTKSRKDVSSDTPQSILSVADLENEIYASSANFGNESNTKTETSKHKIDTNDTTKNAVDRSVNGETSNDSLAIANSSSTLTSQASSILNSNENEVAKRVEKLNFKSIYKGYNGITASEMLIKFRETFLNIDNNIVDSLDDLFMGLY